MTAPPPRARRPLDLVLSEVLEVAAASLALALVLKLFVVEVYQIPSGSMQPTLLGDPAAGRHDRIVADKTVTLARGPRRWEVTILRHPLDERRLYVKRVVGLPGETVEILGGDVWIDGVLAVKTGPARETLLRDVAPAEPDGLDLARWFAADPGVVVEGTRATVAGPGRAGLTLRRSVRDEPLHGHDPAWGLADRVPARHAVADLELSCTVTPGPDARALVLGFDDDEGLLEVVVPVRGGDARPAVRPPPRPGQPLSPVDLPALDPAPLERGRPQRVRAGSIDRRLTVSIDGRPWLTWDDAAAGPRPDQPRRALVHLDLLGGGTLEALQLRRDTFYLASSRPAAGQPRRWRVPPEQYFLLGDNTQDSHDSRSWAVLELTLADGRVLVGHDFPAPPGPVPDDANPRPGPDGALLFTDVHGDTHVLEAGRLPPWERRPAPFVHRRYLLGKPSAVVWPPDRWGLVR